MSEKDKDITISFFKDVKTIKPEVELLSSIFTFIKDGKFTPQITKLRSATNTEQYANIKKTLPAVTFSGLFKERRESALLKYRNIICLDIDKLPKDKLHSLRQTIKADPYVYSYFISPGGQGLKILVKVSSDEKKHKDVFCTLENYFKERYGVDIDKSGKDVCRLCFISSDPEIYVNEKAAPFDYLRYSIEHLVKFTEKIENYFEGNRNNFIFLLANNCNRAGVPKDDTFYYITSNYDMPEVEVKTAVKSAYQNVAQFGTQNLFSLRTLKDKSDEKAKPKKNDGEFWFTIEIQGVKKTLLHYGRMLEFLCKHGFYRLKNDETYQFIYIKDNIVKAAQELFIKDFIIQWLEIQKEYDALEMIRRGSKNYFAKHILEQLPYKEITFKRDTKDTCYLYFKGCYVEITGKEVKEKSYKNMDNFIWDTQIIDREFKFTDDTQTSDFSKFLVCIAAKDKSKMASISTAIGYLLHDHKDASITKAVVAVDSEVQTEGEPNGRTGKSLLGKCLGYVRKTAPVDGQNFSFNKPFPFQTVNLDTQIINFHDCDKKFEFVKLFSLITEDFFIEKKRQDAFHIPFDKSPKIYIDTNYVLKGTGASYEARQFIIEFSNFFTPENTVAKYFNRLFFYEWDAEQWNLFYSCMVQCIKNYLSVGLRDFPKGNYEYRQLVDMCKEDFVIFMEDVKIGERHDKKEIFDKFRGQYPDFLNLRMNTFTRWIKMWAKYKNIGFNLHKNGERDKSGDNEYITLKTFEKAKV